MSPINRLAPAFVIAICVLLPVCNALAQIRPFGRHETFMTKEDLQMLDERVQKLLKSGKVGSVASWKNDKSGNFGTIELELVFAGNGIPCRRLDHVIKFKGQADPRIFRLTYCRVGDEWKLTE